MTKEVMKSSEKYLGADTETEISMPRPCCLIMILTHQNCVTPTGMGYGENPVELFFRITIRERSKIFNEEFEEYSLLCKRLHVQNENRVIALAFICNFKFVYVCLCNFTNNYKYLESITKRRKMVNLQTLNTMSCADITKMNKQQLKDVSKIKVDTSLPVQERLSNYLQSVENPYCFMVGTSPVKISFSSNGKSLDDILMNYLQNQKKP